MEPQALTRAWVREGERLGMQQVAPIAGQPWVLGQVKGSGGALVNEPSSNDIFPIHPKGIRQGRSHTLHRAALGVAPSGKGLERLRPQARTDRL
jgi:hypothetical protein